MISTDTSLINHHLNCVNGCKSATIPAHLAQAGYFYQVKYFFTHIFNTADWPPRWHCGNWSDFHGWLYIFSDLGIWAAYFAIPVLLIRLLLKRRDIPFHIVFFLFGAFILLCGLTHLIDAIIFWWPAYRLSALLRFITAVVSIATVYALYKIIPLAQTLRSVKELEAEIEKRRVLEQKLAASEFLLSEAGRISRVGGWELDIEHNISTWSKTIYDVYELPYDTNIANVDAISYFPEPYHQVMTDALDKAYSEGLKWDVELLFTTHKNNTIWVRSIGEPAYDETGKMIKLRGIFMDIDRYKTNELALHKSLELISLHNRQLKDFTHILSHNVRNHASNMSLILSLLDLENMDANNADLIEKMNKVSGGLNSTLDDLGEAIKIKESTIKTETLEFDKVLNKVLEIFAPEIEMSGAKLELQFEVKEVKFPPIYLESILMNLLSNCIKYRKPDERLVILFKTYKNYNFETVLECHDNGQGIDLNLHGKKIFGLYKTFHDRKDAHGVGLFLVKTQIESQGGAIEVESIKDKGSVFRIIFNEED